MAGLPFPLLTLRPAPHDALRMTRGQDDLPFLSCIELSSTISCQLVLAHQICFDKKHSLPIGYISSPAISNAVMYDFDKMLYIIVNENQEKIGKGVVTRYADDIVFSTDIKG